MHFIFVWGDAYMMDIGKYTIIEEGVTIGKDVKIGNGVVIYKGTKIGDHVVIHDHAVIGKQPMRAKRSALSEKGEVDGAIIGNGCTIGTSSIIYAGATLGDDVFVADLATVRERVLIGKETIVGRGVAIENDCKIGERCKLETNSYITAYSYLEDDVFIAPCVVTTNDNFMGRTKERFKHFKGVTVKRGGRIGANATVLPGKVVAEDAQVAAGSVVTKHVMSEQVVLGNPAKAVRRVPEEQLLKNQ